MIGLLTHPLAKTFGEEEAVRLLAGGGFDAADYSMHVHGLSDPLYDQPLGEVIRRYEALGKLMQSAGLRVCQMHTLYPTYTGRPEADQRLRRATRYGLWAAKALGCPYAVVHPMLLAQPLSEAVRQATWEMNLDFYSQLIPILKETGVQLGIENMFLGLEGRYGPTPVSTGEDMAAYIDRLNDLAGEERFVACLDTGHAHLLGLSVAQMAACLGKRLRLVHLHDNDRTSDRHTAPFLGTLDWTATLQALSDAGYDGCLSFETHGFVTAFPPELMPHAVRLLSAVGRRLEAQLACLKQQKDEP
ncbi:MAG TPA: sugar phosphate isomerase/epimerase [Candidatus Limiplasma stercoravium]|nr:sugar phosphate isomerase/epimerase [Candidatus Limiplasma stercoravium]